METTNHMVLNNFAGTEFAPRQRATRHPPWITTVSP
jgi:hypothetical protein